MGLLDMYNNKTLNWKDFASSVKEVTEKNISQFACRKVLPGKPKEEDYFYANPQECLSSETKCLMPPVN